MADVGREIEELDKKWNACWDAFRRSGDRRSLEEGISSMRKAITLTREDHANMRIWLSRLGISVHSLFQRTENLSDVDEAINLFRKAAELTPDDHVDKPRWLGNTGNCYESRFTRTGDISDLTQAIFYKQAAIELTPAGDHLDLATRLNNLGNSFTSRYKRTWDLADLAEAISLKQRAAQLLPEDHAEMPNVLNNLGISFHRRFYETSDLIDLQEAISSFRKAVELTPDGHAALGPRLHNLGSSLQTRYYKTNELPDLVEAIPLLQRAIQLTADDPFELPIQLNSLGIAFRSRFYRTGDLKDVDEAISSIQKAIQITPLHHPNMPVWLSSLAVSQQMRFDRTGELAHSDEAISTQRQALNLTPEDHSDLLSRKTNMGMFLEQRFRKTFDYEDISAAIGIFRDAAISPYGFPADRFLGARKWVELSERFMPAKSIDAYRTLIPLVSEVANLGQTVQKRLASLPDMSYLSTSAAAAALKEGQPGLALEWLEEARCLVWQQLNNLRTPLDDLRDRDPSIYTEIQHVARHLDAAGSLSDTSLYDPETISISQKVSMRDNTTAHIRLAQRWNQLLEKVRAISGFENFLRPASCSSLLRMLPDSGVVVLINVHKDRSDALALISGMPDPLHIPLEEFSYDMALHLRNALKSYLHVKGYRTRGTDLDIPFRGMRPANRDSPNLKDILKQLWLLVVRPILNGLGYSTSTPAPEKQRIWWCTTGPLAFLPVHAAGIYNESENISVSDFAISSYTPTITALLGRREKTSLSNDQTAGFLIVSQPHTPGLSPIPATSDEARGIQTLLRGNSLRHLWLDDKAATIEETATNLRTYSCVHLACHAIQDIDKPLESGFFLQNGQLCLSQIIKENLNGADLAFLSACQTSTGDEKLSEESVHLAAGMLAAGYRGVVATMWSIQDKHGPQIATDFYTCLLEDKRGKVNGEKAAKALHYATKAMRTRLDHSEWSLLAWVPYVHFGA